MSNEYYTVDDIARIFGVSKATAYKIASLKDVPSIRIGRSIRIDREGFDQWRRDSVGKKIIA